MQNTIIILKVQTKNVRISEQCCSAKATAVKKAQTQFWHRHSPDMQTTMLSYTVKTTPEISMPTVGMPCMWVNGIPET